MKLRGRSHVFFTAVLDLAEAPLPLRERKAHIGGVTADFSKQVDVAALL